jgi:hypothetical protein
VLQCENKFTTQLIIADYGLISAPTLLLFTKLFIHHTPCFHLWTCYRSGGQIQEKGRGKVTNNDLLYPPAVILLTTPSEMVTHSKSSDLVSRSRWKDMK